MQRVTRLIKTKITVESKVISAIQVYEHICSNGVKMFMGEGMMLTSDDFSICDKDQEVRAQ